MFVLKEKCYPKYQLWLMKIYLRTKKIDSLAALAFSSSSKLFYCYFLLIGVATLTPNLQVANSSNKSTPFVTAKN